MAATKRSDAKAAMRADILHSARDFFGGRGYEAATVRDVASDVGVSTGCIFAHFKDKAELFSEAMGVPAPEVRPLLEKLLNADPWDSVGDFQPDIKALHAALYGVGEP